MLRRPQRFYRRCIPLPLKQRNQSSYQSSRPKRHVRNVAVLVVAGKRGLEIPPASMLGSWRAVVAGEDQFRA
jgi:hypothetical protein